eukprot:ctg_620.g339
MRPRRSLSSGTQLRIQSAPSEAAGRHEGANASESRLMDRER